ncbi:MAG: hypothetical protein ACYDBV_13885 [Nitrospiria bacterium]
MLNEFRFLSFLRFNFGECVVIASDPVLIKNYWQCDVLTSAGSIEKVKLTDPYEELKPNVSLIIVGSKVNYDEFENTAVLANELVDLTEEIEKDTFKLLSGIGRSVSG